MAQIQRQSNEATGPGPPTRGMEPSSPRNSHKGQENKEEISSGVQEDGQDEIWQNFDQNGPSEGKNEENLRVKNEKEAVEADLFWDGEDGHPEDVHFLLSFFYHKFVLFFLFFHQFQMEETSESCPFTFNHFWNIWFYSTY